MQIYAVFGSDFDANAQPGSSVIIMPSTHCQFFIMAGFTQ